MAFLYREATAMAMYGNEFCMCGDGQCRTPFTIATPNKATPGSKLF